MAKRKRRKKKSEGKDVVGKTDELMHRVEKCIIKHGPEGEKTERCIEKAQREVMGDDE